MLVVIESPYGAEDEQEQRDNIEYRDACILDSLHRGEAPFASHRMYTGVLNDKVRAERSLGMMAGFLWSEKADLIAVYQDRGVSAGMERGIEKWEALEIPILYRSLGKQWERKTQPKKPLKRVK